MASKIARARALYKLALYVFTAGLLNQTVPLSALVNLARMQAPSGGFYTGYDANFSNDGTSTNTETTSLAIMALEAVSSFQASTITTTTTKTSITTSTTTVTSLMTTTVTTTTQPLLTWAYAIMVVFLIVGLVVGYTIKRPSLSKPADHPTPSKSLVQV